MPTMDGITFYPELRWFGYRVKPLRWVQNTSDPILLCQLDLTAGVPGRAQATERVRQAHDVVQGLLRSGQVVGREHPASIVLEDARRELAEAGQRSAEFLEDHGWRFKPRDLPEREVHVDELEKIEGPPPAEAF